MLWSRTSLWSASCISWQRDSSPWPFCIRIWSLIDVCFGIFSSIIPSRCIAFFRLRYLCRRCGCHLYLLKATWSDYSHLLLIAGRAAIEISPARRAQAPLRARLGPGKWRSRGPLQAASPMNKKSFVVTRQWSLVITAMYHLMPFPEPQFLPRWVTLTTFCAYHSSDTIRYDTRCYFNVRSKADISQLNLPHGTDN